MPTPRAYRLQLNLFLHVLPSGPDRQIPRVAVRVRVELVRDGFPTDRVELTAGCEPGRAGLEPADSPHGRFVQYFRVLFTFEDERHYAEQLAK